MYTNQEQSMFRMENLPTQPHARLHEGKPLQDLSPPASCSDRADQEGNQPKQPHDDLYRRPGQQLKPHVQSLWQHQLQLPGQFPSR